MRKSYMDLKTGYLLREEVAEDRTSTTWTAWVDERRKALGTHGLSVVSDRAKALMQLAAQGLACLSMPDVFPLVHEIVKSSSLALAGVYGGPTLKIYKPNICKCLSGLERITLLHFRLTFIWLKS